MKYLRMHNDSLSEFNRQLYKDVFTQENVISNKKALNIFEEKFYGYFLEKDKKMYFLPEDSIKKVPFKVTSTKEFDYRGDVYEGIVKLESIKIPSEKRMEFRELIDNLPNFDHSNPLHFTLFKILMVTAWCDRINARISTDAGFGKDSVLGIISSLVNSSVNLYGGTFAKLEYVLLNKLIVLNELGNLKADDKVNFQEFLLATGAMHNRYDKRTRSTKSTQESYDISRLSLLSFYNLPSYYVNKAQEYFDQIFTEAVTNRFIPFVFEGVITAKFNVSFNPKIIVEENLDYYKAIIATLNYYKNNNLTNIKYEVNKKIAFPETLMRYDRSFKTILKYMGEYCNSQEEFDMMSLELYDCYIRYGKLINKENKRLELE